LREICDAANIKWNVLAGNPDVISRIVREYESGDTRVLFLNAQHRGAGINLTCTTHVVVYHKMNAASEKQVIGRAYRMGRTEPLDVMYLCNPGE
jgi:SNF2 family DNA or RNA helicase